MTESLSEKVTSREAIASRNKVYAQKDVWPKYILCSKKILGRKSLDKKFLAQKNIVTKIMGEHLFLVQICLGQ